MPLHWAVLSELGHYGALVPLVLCLVLAFAKREPKADAWLLAAAFFVSFVTDQIGVELAHQHRNNWWLVYLEAPIQFGLLAAVVAQRRAVRSVAVMGILLLGFVSALRGTLGEPETMTQVIGGLVVAWLLVEVPKLKPYRRALMVYCLGCAPFLLAMGAISPYAPSWVWWWAGYMVCRITGMALMSVALVREATHGGPHGLWLVDHPRERRAGVRGAGGSHRHVLATTKR